MWSYIESYLEACVDPSSVELQLMCLFHHNACSRFQVMRGQNQLQWKAPSIFRLPRDSKILINAEHYTQVLIALHYFCSGTTTIADSWWSIRRCDMQCLWLYLWLYNLSRLHSWLKSWNPFNFNVKTCANVFCFKNLTVESVTSLELQIHQCQRNTDIFLDTSTFLVRLWRLKWRLSAGCRNAEVRRRLCMINIFD